MSKPPGDDKRWKIVDVTMRRNGYAGHALIETLHTVQDCFGYLDEASLRYAALSLGLPLSTVTGKQEFKVIPWQATGERKVRMEVLRLTIGRVAEPAD